MPIAVRVVSEDEFTAWLAKAKQSYSSTDGAPISVAAAAPPQQSN
jgi:heme/copper-type cytochrome/quinol oxidase subunit 2